MEFCSEPKSSSEVPIDGLLHLELVSKSGAKKSEVEEVTSDMNAEIRGIGKLKSLGGVICGIKIWVVSMLRRREYNREERGRLISIRDKVLRGFRLKTLCALLGAI